MHKKQRMGSDWTRRDLLGIVPGIAASSVAAATASTATPALCYRSGRELPTLLRTRQLSSRELMSAHLEAIRLWNPHLNAIVARLPDEECLRLAQSADARFARGEPIGALHGLPWAFKDLEPTIGFPWTRGSSIFRADHPTSDSVLVQ